MFTPHAALTLPSIIYADSKDLWYVLFLTIFLCLCAPFIINFTLLFNASLAIYMYSFHSFSHLYQTFDFVNSIFIECLAI